MVLRILHTSDWHLGRTLYGRRRYDEFKAFLTWLEGTLHKERVDMLLVAGDVFDTCAPSNRAQTLYYQFLCQVATSGYRHVVVIAGNHDSPSFLEAPKTLLKALNVHVVGSACERLEDELLILDDRRGDPVAIVCAIPYLRDRDIRQADPGETIEDKERKLMEGIERHYAQVVALAESKRRAIGRDVPIIGMGHLFTADGKTVDGDGVRELYVGTLAHVHPAIFPQSLDYVALGHLHVPQRVNGSEVIRYSGSPIPMGFGEAGQRKSVCLVAFDGANPVVDLIDVPLFQRLERIEGTWEQIEARIRKLALTGESVWLEITYSGKDVIPDLRERLDQTVAGSKLEILRVTNRRIVQRVLDRMHEDETLDDLQPEDVFMRCLTEHDVPEEQRPGLLHAYREILRSLEEDDSMAE